MRTGTRGAACGSDANPAWVRRLDAGNDAHHAKQLSAFGKKCLNFPLHCRHHTALLASAAWRAIPVMKCGGILTLRCLANSSEAHV